ncbi:hypothetical protein Cpir12675_000343 [Ceratocystis pirilliformis]|uniref:Catabolite repression protein creC n=1 Tax=Ceratocystis pirilliformis TaxID=259994 RepID=A0ABR3ZLQ0_9PEZI
MENWGMMRNYWIEADPYSRSVLPPPPKYGTGAYGGPPPPIIETNNQLSTPTGDKCQFLVGEGTYVQSEELRLAVPPPHPSESAPPNPNPLATTKQVQTAGTKISLVRFDDNTNSLGFYRGSSATTSSLGRQSASTQDPSVVETRPSHDIAGALSSDDGRANSVSDDVSSVAPAFGEGNSLLLPPINPKDNKRKKPKSNLTKSNSSFISRAIVHDLLAKKVAEHAPDGIYAFVNCNRSVQWLDLSSPTKVEYLTKILFTKGHCLCHDVNQIIKSPNHIDVIMGFNTGEIIWWEPFSQRYSRINKNGIINNHPVECIKWIPGSENLFIAGHTDGSLIVYDKEKEDAPLNTDEEPTIVGQDIGQKRSRFKIEKSVKSKNQKTNPVSWWRLNNTAIKEIAFSPDNRYLTIVSSNIAFRLVDYLEERQEDMFDAYFGRFTCICWSPDGKYIVTGSEDDLITIWSVADRCAVAWCKGHKSWPSAVAFDQWRCDDRNYRFGSIGQDCRLCLWDFNAGMVARPKASMAHRGSVASKVPPPTNPQAKSQDIEHENGTYEHGPAYRNNMPQLIPVCSHEADSEILSGLVFTEKAILTSSKAGIIKTWMRPSSDSSSMVQQ